MKLFHYVENEVGDGIRHFAALGVNAAENHVLVELRVAGRVVLADPFRALHPEVRDKFARFVERDFLGVQILLQVGPEHFVDAAETRPVAHDSLERVHRPQRLHGFAEAARLVFGHVFERVDYVLVKFLFAFARLAFHLFEQGDVALVPNVGGVEAAEHGFEKFRSVGVEAAAREALVDFLAQSLVADVEHAVEADRSVADRADVQKRNAVLRPFAECGRAHDEFAGKDPKRRVLRDAHGRERIFRRERKSGVRAFGESPVGGCQALAVRAGQAEFGQMVRDGAQTLRAFGLPGRAPVYIERLFAHRRRHFGLGYGLRVQAREQRAKPE